HPQGPAQKPGLVLFSRTSRTGARDRDSRRFRRPPRLFSAVHHGPAERRRHGGGIRDPRHMSAAFPPPRRVPATVLSCPEPRRATRFTARPPRLRGPNGGIPRATWVPLSPSHVPRGRITTKTQVGQSPV